MIRTLPTRAVAADDTPTVDASFLIRERVVGEIQIPGFGVDYLQPGLHHLYYRATDASGTEGRINSLTIVVDDLGPQLTFNVINGQVVGPETPLSFFATDTGSGVNWAKVDVPSVGSLNSDTVFSLGESQLQDEVDSGDTIKLSAEAADRVTNGSTRSVELRYDFEGPMISVIEITDAVRLFDGRYITTSPEVEIRVEVKDDAAGVRPDSIVYTGGSSQSGVATSSPLVQDPDGIWRAKVLLVESLNQVQISASDQSRELGSGTDQSVCLSRSRRKRRFG